MSTIKNLIALSLLVCGSVSANAQSSEDTPPVRKTAAVIAPVAPKPVDIYGNVTPVQPGTIRPTVKPVDNNIQNKPDRPAVKAVDNITSTSVAPAKTTEKTAVTQTIVPAVPITIVDNNSLKAISPASQPPVTKATALKVTVAENAAPTSASPAMVALPKVNIATSTDVQAPAVVTPAANPQQVMQDKPKSKE